MYITLLICVGAAIHTFVHCLWINDSCVIWAAVVMCSWVAAVWKKRGVGPGPRFLATFTGDEGEQEHERISEHLGRTPE